MEGKILESTQVSVNLMGRGANWKGPFNDVNVFILNVVVFDNVSSS